MSVFDLSIEELIATGVDGRVAYDPRTGLNAYGSSLTPRTDALHFATSTASAPTPRVHSHLEDVRNALRHAALDGRPDAVLAAAFESMRSRLATQCGLDPAEGVDLVLTASGTEALLFASTLARAHQPRPSTAVVIGPDETGTGVIDALLGRHFAAETPLGTAVTTGTGIVGTGGHEVRLETVAMRTDNGSVRDPAEIDAEVSERVAAIVAAERHAVVCLQDSSKTGVMAPSLRAAKAVRSQHGDRVDVIVDACQMRASRQRLRSYVAAGFIVAITGSKFFGAPPFCGAILLPVALARTYRAGRPLPRGFADYTVRCAWPESWEPVCRHLPRAGMPGLLFRWEAAIAEMARFQRVPPAIRARTVRELRDIVERHLAACPWIQPAPVAFHHVQRRALPRPWERLPTIFPFHVLAWENGALAPLDLERSKRLHRRLNAVGTQCADREATPTVERILSTPCHLGQPVALPLAGGRSGGALRLVFGASMIADAAYDPAYGATFEDRLQRAADAIDTVVRKIALIAEGLGRDDPNLGDERREGLRV